MKYSNSHYKTAASSSSTHIQKLIKMKAKCISHDRLQNFKDVDALPLTKPGLSYMIQVHLYSKQRSLLPVHL